MTGSSQSRLQTRNRPASYRPPESCEELIILIRDRHDNMSKSKQKIALYLKQNPNDVAALSVNAIGAKCESYASNFVRYAQSPGQRGFKELQSVPAATDHGGTRLRCPGEGACGGTWRKVRG
jgi:Helix-turn-helix domain, rpiR family